MHGGWPRVSLKARLGSLKPQQLNCRCTSLRVSLLAIRQPCSAKVSFCSALTARQAQARANCSRNKRKSMIMYWTIVKVNITLGNNTVMVHITLGKQLSRSTSLWGTNVKVHITLGNNCRGQHHFGEQLSRPTSLRGTTVMVNITLGNNCQGPHHFGEQLSQSTPLWGTSGTVNITPGNNHHGQHYFGVTS